MAGGATLETASRERGIYRLRGEVAGVERAFDLPLGEYLVGSSNSSDVSLPLRGISRRHAVLLAGPTALVVEDRRSTNGTFVDDHRVERAVVAPGAVLRFGPVRLRLELLAADDAALAIDMRAFAEAPPAQQTSVSSLALIETTGLDFGDENAAATAPERPPRLSFPDSYRPGSSASMSALYRQMEKLLAADMPILICGETGAGKELVARTLHASSPRQGGPFVPLNCSAIPAELLEAELFGVARAVATGVEQRPGMFQLAHGGTLFLDEVSEMAAALQAKLLRALQGTEIRPVGGTAEAVDVRIVAATNADLGVQMNAGHFRRDLYYRLAGYTLEVPPLRRCRDDIPGLVEHFLRRFAAETDTRIRGITVKALRHLAAYPWPGNVRELENEVRRLVYLAADGQVLDSGLVSPAILDTPVSGSVLPAGADSLTLAPRVRALETELIREALRRAGGKPTHAARLLGLSRNGLMKKMKRLGIER